MAFMDVPSTRQHTNPDGSTVEILKSCQIGNRVTIHATAKIGNGVVLGDDVSIGANVKIEGDFDMPKRAAQVYASLPDNTSVGVGTIIAPGVEFRRDPGDMDQWDVTRGTRIGENCSIEPDSYFGARAHIGDGVTVRRAVHVGEYVVIGSHSELRSCVNVNSYWRIPAYSAVNPNPDGSVLILPTKLLP